MDSAAIKGLPTWPKASGNMPKVYLTLKPLDFKKKKKKKRILELGSRKILSIFSTFLSQKHIKKKPLIPLFSQQSRGSVLALFLVLGP